MATPSRLVRVVVNVASLDASLSFYSGLLELPVASRSDDMATLDLGGCELFLHQREGASTGAGVAVCLRAADLSHVVTSWRRDGGVVIDEPARQPWGEVMGVVCDPDGYIVCLVEAD